MLLLNFCEVDVALVAWRRVTCLPWVCWCSDDPISSARSRGDGGAVLESWLFDGEIRGDLYGSVGICFTFREEVRLGRWTMTTTCCVGVLGGLGEDIRFEAVRDR